jgi:hypothetical protein
MPTAVEIILEYVCPGLGCIVAYVMFMGAWFLFSVKTRNHFHAFVPQQSLVVLIEHCIIAPVKDVRKAVGNGTLGVLNPTPWAVMTGNCVGW